MTRDVNTQLASRHRERMIEWKQKKRRKRILGQRQNSERVVCTDQRLAEADLGNQLMERCTACQSPIWQRYDHGESSNQSANSQGHGGDELGRPGLPGRPLGALGQIKSVLNNTCS